MRPRLFSFINACVEERQTPKSIYFPDYQYSGNDATPRVRHEQFSLSRSYILPWGRRKGFWRSSRSTPRNSRFLDFWARVEWKDSRKLYFGKLYNYDIVIWKFHRSQKFSHKFQRDAISINDIYKSEDKNRIVGLFIMLPACILL